MDKEKLREAFFGLVSLPFTSGGEIKDYAETILSLRQDGATTDDIGKKIYYTGSSVRRFLGNVGDPLGGRRGCSQVIQRKHQRAYELMDQGLNDTKIAKQMQLEGNGYVRAHITLLRHRREKGSK